MATGAGANLLLVHHGLFWSARQPWTGPRLEMIRLLVEHDLAVYSSHLPLDAHPRIGNSRLLARALALPNPRPFFEARGQLIGVRADARLERTELARRLAVAAGTPPIILPGGPAICLSIGIVTGGAGADLADAARQGVDTFVTGEGPHWTAALAEELQLNVLYAGHYATETFGVKGLAAHLSRRFGIPWEFMDCPTGL